MEINHSEREHARYSPSSLESREACAGWENKDGDSLLAKDGETCHEATEGLVRGNAAKYEALPLDLASFVKDCYSYVEPRIVGAELLVLETRIFHENPILKKNSHGSPDVVAITGRSALIIDYKFGRRPVSNARVNLQGWTYALAVFDTYDVDEVTVDFVVPRVHRCTSSHTFTRAADYTRMLARVLRTVEQAMLPESKKKLVVSWDACAYCGRKAGCIAIRKALEREYDIVMEPKKGSYTPAQLLQRKLETAKLAKDYAEQVEENILKKALEEGADVEGYELRIAAGKTSTKSLDVIASALEDSLSLADLTKIATVPLGKLKELYAANAQTGSKKDAEAALMTALIEGDALKSGQESPYLYRLNSKL